MAEPVEVCIKGKDEVIGYACPTCKLFCSPMIYACKWEDAIKAAYQHAAECCDKYCAQCNDPLPGRADRSQLPSPWPYTICPACKKAADAKKDAERFEKAEKVPEVEYTGPVYWEDGHGPQDGFFRSIEDLRDYIGDDDHDLPEWVWACTERGIKFSAEDMLENELSEHYEDAYEDIGREGEQALQDVLDKWVTEHASEIKSWDPDFSRVVIVNKEVKPNEDRRGESADRSGE